MNIANKTASPQDNELHDGSVKQLPVLNVLKRLSGGESLIAVMNATGLSERDLRACFQFAHDAVAKSSGITKAEPVPDWRTMSVADALQLLAIHAKKP